MADRIILPTALDANGDTVASAQAFFYETGTTTPLTVYSDEAATVPVSQPLLADSAGVFAATFATQIVKLDIQTPGGVSLAGFPSDPHYKAPSGSSAASGVSFSPTTENPETNVQDAIELLSESVLSETVLSSTITSSTIEAAFDIPSTWKAFRLIAWNVLPVTTDAGLRIEFGTAGSGGSMVTSANYFTHIRRLTTTTPLDTTIVGGSDFGLTPAIRNSSGFCHLSYEFYGVNTTSGDVVGHGSGYSINSTPETVFDQRAFSLGVAGNYNAFKVLMSSGNIATMELRAERLA